MCHLHYFSICNPLSEGLILMEYFTGFFEMWYFINNPDCLLLLIYFIRHEKTLSFKF